MAFITLFPPIYLCFPTPPSSRRDPSRSKSVPLSSLLSPEMSHWIIAGFFPETFSSVFQNVHVASAVLLPLPDATTPHDRTSLPAQVRFTNRARIVSELSPPLNISRSELFAPPNQFFPPSAIQPVPLLSSPSAPAAPSPSLCGHTLFQTRYAPPPRNTFVRRSTYFSLNLLTTGGFSFTNSLFFPTPSHSSFPSSSCEPESR